MTGNGQKNNLFTVMTGGNFYGIVLPTFVVYYSGGMAKGFVEDIVLSNRSHRFNGMILRSFK